MPFRWPYFGQRVEPADCDVAQLSLDEGKSITTETTAALLNSYNATQGLPQLSDVVIVGGGIHSLMYAIHTRKLELQKSSSKTPGK